MNKETLVNNELPIITEYNKTFQNSNLEEVIIEVQNNNPIAMYELARRYQYGYGDVEQNIINAVELYKNILKLQRNVSAMYQLGYLYAFCDDQLGEENRLESVGYLQAAVELGDPDAAVQLGILYESGDLVNADYNKALELYEYALKEGASNVYSNIGHIYRHMEAWDKAIDFYQKALEEGDMTAALSMGFLYEKGYGVEQNDKKAFELYQLAYEDGDPDAPYFLGTMYYFGRGTEENEGKAFPLLKEAAEQGDERVNLCLGDLYRRGVDGVVEKNLELALEYLSNISEPEEGVAWYLKGLIYLELKNDESIEWFKKAAGRGNDDAKRMLRFFIGEDVNKIEDEIPDLVKDAVKGNEKFCMCLAVIFMGDSSFGPDYYDFEKMKFWTNRCLSLHTPKGDLYYAECLSRWAKIRRKNRIYDGDVLSDLQKSNEILLQLKRSGECDIDEINATYYQNEWEMGWVICYSDLKDAANLSKAYSYFEDVCENYLCSDALHGIAVVSLFKDDTFRFAQYTAKALEYNKWLDNEMYANCLHNMGGIFLAQTNSKDNLENAYQHFSKAAELGYEDSKKELSRFHRTFLGKLKYE